MFGSVFGQAAGFLDRRFVLTIVLPSLAFWGGLALFAAQGAGWGTASHWWTARTGFEQALLAGTAVAGLPIFSFIAAGLLTFLTRLWEGYWPGSTDSRLAPYRYAARLAAWRVKRHTDRWRSLDLDKDRDYMRRFYQFPVRQADVLPTRLGNVLRAAEDYPGDDERYGMDAVFYWPRLYLVLPAETRSLVDSHRSGLDRMMLLASLTVPFPIASLIISAVAGISWIAWAVSVVIAVVVGVLAYEGAVNAAVAFGDVIRSCFDNYRRTLLEQFGLPLPASLEDERKLWGAFKQQLYQRGTDDPSVLKSEAAAREVSSG
jgi:hypothetical protein